MTRGGGRDWRAIGCAALMGASIAFPLGLLVSGEGPSRPGTRDSAGDGPAGGKTAASRNPYSPRVLDDPAVIDQQRRVAEALATSCDRYKLHCAEAEQARLRIEEAEARR